MVDLSPLANLTGQTGPAGQDALGTEPQQQVIADWIEAASGSNPLSTQFDSSAAALIGAVFEISDTAPTETTKNGVPVIWIKPTSS